MSLCEHLHHTSPPYIHTHTHLQPWFHSPRVPRSARMHKSTSSIKTIAFGTWSFTGDSFLLTIAYRSLQNVTLSVGWLGDQSPDTQVLSGTALYLISQRTLCPKCGYLKCPTLVCVGAQAKANNESIIVNTMCAGKNIIQSCQTYLASAGLRSSSLLS